LTLYLFNFKNANVGEKSVKDAFDSYHNLYLEIRVQISILHKN